MFKLYNLYSLLLGIFLSMLFVQIYLYFKLSFFDFYATIFYCLVIFLTLALITVSYYKGKSFFVRTGFCIVIIFFAIPYYFKYISNHYFNQAIIESEILVKDLYEYKKNHQKYPDELADIYKAKDIPFYNIGAISYDFGYLKKDSIFKLYFKSFEGRMYYRTSIYNEWNIDD